MCNPTVRSALGARAFAAFVLLTCSPFVTAQGNEAVILQLPPLLGTPAPGTFGWDFRVNQPLVVGALGVADFFNGPSGPPGDGLALPHHVTLYTSAGVPVADATVPAGTAAQYRAPFRYVTISPVTLDPGNYVIGAFYGSGASEFSPDAMGGHLGGNDTLITPPALTVTGGRRAFGGDVFPEGAGVPSFGPNMLITVIPEPGAIALLTLGTGAIALRPARRAK